MRVPQFKSLSIIADSPIRGSFSLQYKSLIRGFVPFLHGKSFSRVTSFFRAMKCFLREPCLQGLALAYSFHLYGFWDVGKYSYLFTIYPLPYFLSVIQFESVLTCLLCRLLNKLGLVQFCKILLKHVESCLILSKFV